MFFLLLVFVTLLGYSNCAFFDLTDVDDPLSLLWHTKDTFIKPRNVKCTVPIGTFSVAGVCKHKTHCFLSGGQPYDQTSCGYLSSCCLPKESCFKSTKSKISYFESNFNPATDCSYIVEVQNDNICQIRLDFENFILSGPQSQPFLPSQFKQVCAIDYLTVTPNTYNLPGRFCGNNDGQHAYVHLNGEKEVKLHVHITNRTSMISIANIPNPQWKIKITQLECPGTRNIFFRHKDNTAELDYPQLAPAGAIQYFTEPHGRIRSFGYNHLQRLYGYISGLNYAIAFKKTPKLNCARFTSILMQLDRNAVLPPKCLDYLFVPELETDVDPAAVDGSKLCPLNGTTHHFSSSTPGPLYINFVSSQTYDHAITGLHAFDIEYDLNFC